MKTEIYECDRCHKKAITKEERDRLGLGTVNVGFERHYFGGGDDKVFASHQAWSKDLCRACRAEIGCLEDKVRQAEHNKENTVPSLEDMIRKIVRQELPGGQ